MANSLNALYQTLVAAVAEAVGDGPAAVRVGNLQAIQSVYTDYRPQEKAALGQVLNIPIPASVTSSVADIGVGDFTNTDSSVSTVAVTINKHPGYSTTLRDFEQANTPASMRALFLDGAIKGIMENVNSSVTALFTTGNFNAHSAVSATASLPTTANLLTGRQYLSTSKVPLVNASDVSFLLGPAPMAAVLGNTNWTQESIVGVDIAEEVRRTGTLRVAYGISVKEEQAMPVSGTDPTQTFTGMLLHKAAVAVVARAMPEPDTNVVEYIPFDWNGFPLRVMVGYNQIKGGYVLTIEGAYGLAVARPDHGVVYSIAQ